MQGSSQKFFACAALAPDEDCRLTGRDLLDHVQKLLDNRAGTDHATRRRGCGFCRLRGRALAHELALQRQDAPLLLGDLFDLGLQFAVEPLDGLMPLGAF